MKKFQLVFSVCIIIFILTACNKDNTEQVKENSGTISHTKSDFKEFQYATYQSKKRPHIKITYPVFKSDQINNKLIDLREQEINDFKTVSKEKQDNLVINIQPEKINENNFLFNVNKEVSIDKKESFTRHYSYIVNTKTNQVGVADTLFDISESDRTQLYEKLNQTILESGSIAPYYQPEKLKDYIMNQKNGFNNVNIKNNHLNFYFENGEIGLPAMGTPTIALKISEVVDLFDETLKDTIKGEEEEPSKTSEKNSQDETQNDNSERRTLNANDKMIALTFDDGPKAETTERVLNILDDYDAKATFFMLGRSIEKFPETATEVDKRGHEIGNHSYSHADMLTLPLENVAQEINDTTALIEAHTNQTPRFFRPPYGSFDNYYTEQISLETAYWSVDTKDWSTHNPDMILEEVKQNSTDGSVILMHDIHTDTVDALERVIQYLKSQGFKFVTMSELQKYKGDNVKEMR